MITILIHSCCRKRIKIQVYRVKEEGESKGAVTLLNKCFFFANGEQEKKRLVAKSVSPVD